MMERGGSSRWARRGSERRGGRGALEGEKGEARRGGFGQVGVERGRQRQELLQLVLQLGVVR